VTVTDPEGQVVFDATAQPGAPVPDAVLGAGRGGRGGRGGGGGGGRGGGGRGAAAAAEAGGRGARGGQAGEAAQAGRGGRGQRGGARGGGRGAGGGGGAPAVSAVQGLNRAIWTNLTYDAMFQVPPGTVMWGGRGGGGPKMAPGTYTVKVTSGSWNATETFVLEADPRREPEMTPEEGAEQLRMTRDIGRITKQLYDDIATMRDLKAQAAAHAGKAGANSPVAAASKALADSLTAVEGDMTQLQGSAGQDALNFPGRMDNQLIVLYGSLISPERRLGSAQKERYNDLKPEAEALLQRAADAIKTGVAQFNQVATGAGLPAIEVRPPASGRGGF
jgi:hypothetical protein